MQAVIVLLGALVVAVLWLALSVKKAALDRQALEERYGTLKAELQSSLASSLNLISSQLSGVNTLVNDQLGSFTMQFNSAAGQLNQRMDNAARMVGEVRQNLGELSKTTEHFLTMGSEMGKSISILHDILKAPKLRGGLGEFFLGDLLSQCLPAEHYELQYTFKNGARVDAVVKLNNGLVPIDSKFPLENFRKTIECPADEEKKAAKRRFVADCRRHIDTIAASYILPEEGTLNFALMYIPAENVYYETIVKDDSFGEDRLIAAYAFSKRVIPVSPNSFYAYLQTILLGLRGIEISEKAEQMLSHLNRLKNDFGKFTSDIETLGRHINNAKAKYDDVERKAERFGYALGGPGDTEAPLPKDAGEGENL